MDQKDQNNAPGVRWPKHRISLYIEIALFIGLAVLVVNHFWPKTLNNQGRLDQKAAVVDAGKIGKAGQWANYEDSLVKLSYPANYQYQTASVGETMFWPANGEWELMLPYLNLHQWPEAEANIETVKKNIKSREFAYLNSEQATVAGQTVEYLKGQEKSHYGEVVVDILIIPHGDATITLEFGRRFEDRDSQDLNNIFNKVKDSFAFKN